MKKTLTALILAALLPAAQADPIDDYVRAEQQRRHIPGIALGIYQNGNIVKQQGYGLANVEHQVPVSPDTVFQAASIGKMFTAAAVMLLAEDGKIRLDQSVRTYLPEAPKSWQPVTVRHLLNHTGGIGSTETDWQQNSSEKQMLRRIYAAPLQFKAGSRWAYSNNGYALLGAIITRVSGKHYGEILRERVFAPLGMTSARVISERDIVPNRAAGYELDDNDGSLKNQEWVAPYHNQTADGSLYLTLNDYRRWLEAVRRRKILRPESWREIFTPARLSNGDTYPYGFGWSLVPAPDGSPMSGHPGAWQGFSTELRRYEGDGTDIVILTNLAGTDTEALIEGIAERANPRYKKTNAAIADRYPALTRDFERVLQRIRQGKPHPAVPKGRLKDLHAKFADAGRCRAEPTRHQNNGPVKERDYRVICEHRTFEGNADFKNGKTVRLWLEETAGGR
ncbi:Penicillin-binding protein E [Kingella potus]|uniref:Penicillin-binding protein E n=1 Tax=Kingella potus TaxID=265175 RepID=A0A377R2M3_9NEIS|nr:serine hydrolase domain-containing protein [Kingella potus]UOP01265.1 beta-lactamase family protein [Kingella potus]STR00998.1 Penicillin-binding protein E [Kingella potus]